jgi:hypothetical protein
MNHTEALAHLEDYFDGTLPPDVHRAIEAHLAGCTRCRDELSSLGALLDTVTEMRGKQVEPSRDLWPGIVAEIARGPEVGARSDGDPARRGSRDIAAGGWNSFRTATGGRRERWRWLAGAVGLAAAVLLLAAVLGGREGLLRFTGGAGGVGGGPVVPDSSATVSADGTGVINRELTMLGAQVESSRRSLRPARGAGAADTAAAAPSWRLFDQGLAVLDQAIKDSRAALDRDPSNPTLQKSLLTAYQKQLELIRWANRVVRQG